MTDKHIWKNGETITADLLNGMSDYADEKVDAIPKIDPATLVKTTALASDTNLLAGTSDEWHTWTGDALTNGGWLNLTNDLTDGSFLTVVPGTELSYAAEISPSIDGQIVMSFYTEDKASGKEFFSNVVKAGTSGIAEVTCVIPENMSKAYFRMIRAATHQTESKQVTWRWRREKLNVGPYATPYSLPPVTDVGGQKPVGGHINTDWIAGKEYVQPTIDGVKNLVIGARNYLRDSNQSVTATSGTTTSNGLGQYVGAGTVTADTLNSLRGRQLSLSVEVGWDTATADDVKQRLGTEFSITYTDGTIYYFGVWESPAVGSSSQRHRIRSFYTVPANKTVSAVSKIVCYIQVDSKDSYCGQPMLSLSTVTADWMPAPEDIQYQFGTLNNKISSLQAQISGGGVNLLDVTNGEIGNISGSDGSNLDGFKNLYRTPNMIPVTNKATYSLNVATPGDEKPIIEKICFYDANGIFTRHSFAQATRFDFTPKNGECFIRFTIVSAQPTPGFPDDASWTKYGVTLTVTNSLETRLAALESKINGGTTA